MSEKAMWAATRHIVAVLTLAHNKRSIHRYVDTLDEPELKLAFTILVGMHLSAVEDRAELIGATVADYLNVAGLSAAQETPTPTNPQ